MYALQTHHPHERLRILLVDDNVDAVETLADLLRIFGHQVFTAHDGLAGLRAFDIYEPDVAVVDLALPQMDGFALAQYVRSDARFRATPLIALSCCDTHSDRERTRKIGFDHHLAKPPDLKRLERLLARYLAEAETFRAS